MKVRSDFVTNSSSSSFIIAKNEQCTIEEIKDNLYKNKNDIVSILEDFDLNSDDDSVNRFIDELSWILFNKPQKTQGLRLGEWIASGVKYSNEDDEYGAFMYEYGYKLGTDNFKVG